MFDRCVRPEDIDLKEYHKQSFNNRDFFEDFSGDFGCFNCKKIWVGAVIPDMEFFGWTDNDKTALCPNCEIDTVVPLPYAAYSRMQTLLNRMSEFAFGTSSPTPKDATPNIRVSFVDPDAYQRQALSTEKTPGYINPDLFGETQGEILGRTLHGLVGLATEVGEAQDMVKKHLIYGRPFDRVNILEEMGDILWYVALTLDSVGYKMSEAMERNIEKLNDRYGGEFSQEKANVRDLEKERKTLERIRQHESKDE